MKFKKLITTATVAAFLVSSFGMMAFAGDAKKAPVQKSGIKITSTTKCVYNAEQTVTKRAYHANAKILTFSQKKIAFINKRATKAKLIIQKRTQTVLSKTYDPAKRAFFLEKEQIALSKVDAWAKKEIAKLTAKTNKAITIVTNNTNKANFEIESRTKKDLAKIVNEYVKPITIVTNQPDKEIHKIENTNLIATKKMVKKANIATKKNLKKAEIHQKHINKLSQKLIKKIGENRSDNKCDKDDSQE